MHSYKFTLKSGETWGAVITKIIKRLKRREDQKKASK